MRSKLALSFFVLFLLVGCLFLPACDSANTPTSSKASTPVFSISSPAAGSSVASTPGAMPTLVADPGWRVVYNHTGDAYHRISEAFTTDTAVVVVLTCQGKGHISVDLSTGEQATTACSNPPQVIRDQYASSAGKQGTINVEVAGDDVRWAVLVVTSHNAAQQ